MKTKLILIISAVVFAFSCSKETSATIDSSTTYPEDGVVRISTQLSDMQVRSAEGTSQYEGTSLALFLDYGDSDPCTLDNTMWTQSGGVWSPSETFYWKSARDMVDIYAYAPYVDGQSAGSVNFTVAEDQSVSGGIAASDFVVYKSTGVTPDSDLEDNSIAITFNHVLAQLNLSFNFGDEFDMDLTVTKVTMHAKGSVIYNLYTESFTTTGDAMAIGGAQVGDQFQVLIAPQTISSGDLLIDIETDSHSFAFTPSSSITFESGAAYNLELNIGRDKVRLDNNIDVVDWAAAIDLGSADAEQTTVSYNVADPYPDAENPIGIVYATYNGGVNGYVVSLDDTYGKWCIAGYTEGSTSKSDGMANTGIIMREQESYPDYYPIYRWIDDKNLELNPDITGADYVSGATGIWYLPAIEEHDLLYSVVDAYNQTGTHYAEIDSLLLAYGGSSINTSQFTYSSTEYTSTLIYVFKYTEGTSVFTYKTSAFLRARPIMAF